MALVAVSPALVFYPTDASSTAATPWPWSCWPGCGSSVGAGLQSGILVWSLASATLIWFSFPAALAAGSGSVVLLVAAVTPGGTLSMWCWQRLVVRELWFESLAQCGLSMATARCNPSGPTHWRRPHGSKIAWIYDVSVGFCTILWAYLCRCCGARGGGAVALLWKRFTLGLFCMVLVGVTLVAGLVRQYPVADRLVLDLIRPALVLEARPAAARHVLLVVVAIVVVSASTFSSAAIAVARPYVMTRFATHRPMYSGTPALTTWSSSRADQRPVHVLPSGAGVTVAGSVFIVPPTRPPSPARPTRGEPLFPPVPSRLGRFRAFGHTSRRRR